MESNLYSHLGKIMDNHYSAIGIDCEAQMYLDHGVRFDITAAREIPYYTQKPQHSRQRDTPLRTDLPPRSSGRPHQHQTSPSNQPGHDHLKIHKDTQHTPRTPLCKIYPRGRPCLHGCNCLYRHPPHTQAQAHIATTDDDLPSTKENFSFGQYEM